MPNLNIETSRSHTNFKFGLACNCVVPEIKKSGVKIKNKLKVLKW
jgi:hypothetical protein